MIMAVCAVCALAGRAELVICFDGATADAAAGQISVLSAAAATLDPGESASFAKGYSSTAPWIGSEKPAIGGMLFALVARPSSSSGEGETSAYTGQAIYGGVYMMWTNSSDTTVSGLATAPLAYVGNDDPESVRVSSFAGLNSETIERVQNFAVLFEFGGSSGWLYRFDENSVLTATVRSTGAGGRVDNRWLVVADGVPYVSQSTLGDFTTDTVTYALNHPDEIDWAVWSPGADMHVGRLVYDIPGRSLVGITLAGIAGNQTLPAGTANREVFITGFEGELHQKVFRFADGFDAYAAGGSRLHEQSADWVRGTGNGWFVENLNEGTVVRSPLGPTNITLVAGTTFWPAEGANLDMHLDYTQSGSGGWFGFVFNYEDPSNYHVFRISPDNEQAQFCKVMNGTPFVVYDEPFFPGSGEGTMSLLYEPGLQRVAITVDGASNAFFKVAGDPTIISGAVGLYSADCSNFKVRQFAAYADRVSSVEIISDRVFQRGFEVNTVASPPTVEGVLQRVTDAGSPRNKISQWGSQQSIYGAVPTVLSSGAWQWSNDYKRVTMGPVGSSDGDVSLYVDSVAEYHGEWLELGDSWPHLLVRQTLCGPGGAAALHAPYLAEMEALEFHVEALLKSAFNSRETGYDPSLHCTKFNVAFTIQLLNPEFIGQGYGDHYGFGIKLYDDRHAKPGFSAGMTKYVYMYNIGIPFTDTGMTVGEWKTISGDLLPYVIQGFHAARAAGALAYSGDLADYKIGGMNIGWEISGLSRVEMQIKNLRLRYVKK